MDFARNLKHICKKNGTNPTSVCKELGLSTSKVSLWNNGSLPKQEILIKLANQLNCKVMDFFADDLSEDIIQEKNEDEQDILRIYRGLERKDKHRFMTMVYDFEQGKTPSEKTEINQQITQQVTNETK